MGCSVVCRVILRGLGRGRKLKSRPLLLRLCEADGWCCIASCSDDSDSCVLAIFIAAVLRHRVKLQVPSLRVLPGTRVLIQVMYSTLCWHGALGRLPSSTKISAKYSTSTHIIGPEHCMRMDPSVDSVAARPLRSRVAPYLQYSYHIPCLERRWTKGPYHRLHYSNDLISISLSTQRRND
jgi:hypothetical protein